MTTSPNLALTYLAEGQEQSEISVNDLINKIEMLTAGVIDKDLSAPPGSPTNGDIYIVGGTGTGDWAGHDDAIAGYYDAWLFIEATEGLMTVVEDEGLVYRFNGSAWVNP